jgi:hypothetical protein
LVVETAVVMLVKMADEGKNPIMPIAAPVK